MKGAATIRYATDNRSGPDSGTVHSDGAGAQNERPLRIYAGTNAIQIAKLRSATITRKITIRRVILSGDGGVIGAKINVVVAIASETRSTKVTTKNVPSPLRGLSALSRFVRDCWQLAV